MIRTLSDTEIKEMKKEMLDWVEKELQSDDAMYLYNILLSIKRANENEERKK